MEGKLNELKELRKSKNLTQTDVAEQLSVALATYHNWEVGKTDLPDWKLGAVMKVIRKMKKKKK